MIPLYDLLRQYLHLRNCSDFEWDFDVMLRKKKSEKLKRRRRRDGTMDLLSDADQQIKELVFTMKEAAEVNNNTISGVARVGGGTLS